MIKEEKLWLLWTVFKKQINNSAKKGKQLDCLNKYIQSGGENTVFLYAHTYRICSLWGGGDDDVLCSDNQISEFPCDSSVDEICQKCSTKILSNNLKNSNSRNLNR